MINHNEAFNPEQEWEQENGIWGKIKDKGTKEYFLNLPEIKKCFKHTAVCACIDEGTPFGSARVAGSGILHPAGAEAVARMLLEAGIKEVTSHEGCGAAALWTKNNGLPAGKAGGEEKEADENGKKFAIEVADKMSELSGRKIGHRHIAAAEMARPAHIHIARAAYYDGTGLFNPSGSGDAPRGFVVSRRYFDKDHSVFNMDLAAQIAFGHHGFGEKFTVENPLHFIAVADQKEDKFNLKNLLSELESLPEKYGGRIKVSGFEVEL